MKASICGVQFVMCDALIDQNHKIGDDFIGYKCAKPATKSFSIGDVNIDVCDVCLNIYKEDPLRVSFPTHKKYS